MRFFNALAAVGMATTISLAAEAKSLGKIGPTYPIKEQDMLEWIQKKVQSKVDSGEVARYQQAQREIIVQNLKNPAPLTTVSNATKNRTFFYDPTFVVEEPVLDDKGRILVPGGTVINPLERVQLSRALIFIDGRDKRQVAFAKKFIDKRNGLVRPVLTAGSYFDLMKAWQMPVYFDQKSALIRQFGIRHVPAIVIQDGRKLRIDEIAL